MRLDEIHALIEWVAGIPVWTHQLPRVCDAVRPHLRMQFAELAAMDLGAVDRDTYPAFAAEQGAVLERIYHVAPCPHPVQLKDPVAELIDLLEAK